MKTYSFKKFMSVFLVLAIALGMMSLLTSYGVGEPEIGEKGGALLIGVSNVPEIEAKYGERHICLLDKGQDFYFPLFQAFNNESITMNLAMPEEGMVEIGIYSAVELTGKGFPVNEAPPDPEWFSKSEKPHLKYSDYVPQVLPDDINWEELDAPKYVIFYWANHLVSGISIGSNMSIGWYYIVISYKQGDPKFDDNNTLALFVPFQVIEGPKSEIELLGNYAHLLGEDGGWIRLVDLLEADPVNMITGALVWEYTDLQLEGAKPLAFSRTYNSMYADNNHGIGFGWSHSFNYRVTMSLGKAYVTLPTGGTVCFTRRNGRYETEPGNMYTFTGDSLIADTGEVVRFSSGRAVEIIDANGDSTSLS